MTDMSRRRSVCQGETVFVICHLSFVIGPKGRGRVALNPLSGAAKEVM